jgi:hypothetical protein
VRTQYLVSGIRNIAMTEAKAIQLFGKPDTTGKVIRFDTLNSCEKFKDGVSRKRDDALKKY